MDRAVTEEAPWDDRFRERFWSKADVRGTEECWEWMRSKNPHGYGWFNVGKRRAAGSHRVAYALAYGLIPEGMCVLHKCDNPSCVNPNHLWLGTQVDNNNDRHEKRREARGEHHGSSRLKTEDVLAIRALYSERWGTMSEIAQWFGLAAGTVGKIIRRELWAHV